MEIDTVYESEKSWGNLKDYFMQLLTIKGGSGIEVEELLVFPGLEELFSMFKILEIYESGEYDTIIVDCAPTGEKLALLKYPESLSGVYVLDDSNITSHIRRLRVKIEDDPANPKYIQTVRGIGYKMAKVDNIDR